MSHPPQTRHSLIARLKDPSDQVAWEEFVSIYRPVVFRVAVKKGLQPADAEDVAQTVMVSVARAVEKWEPDPQRARFRTWLNRIAVNAAINSITRCKPDRGTGESKSMELLAQHPDADSHIDSQESELVRLEYRRESFRVAARQIKSEFEPDTWSAFWLTAVEGVSPQSAADQLGKKLGSIYTAKSRVMKRMQTRVAEMTDFEE